MRVHVCACVYMCVHVCACVCARVCTSVHVCLHVCLHGCVCYGCVLARVCWHRVCLLAMVVYSYWLGELDRVLEAMSHNDVLYEIFGKVLPFLTRHPGRWWMDEHYWEYGTIHRPWEYGTVRVACGCCIAAQAISHTEPECACELCITAWRLSCLLYTSPSPRDLSTSRMPSSA